MGVTIPPRFSISRATVLIVDSFELGSGRDRADGADADVLLDEMTTFCFSVHCARLESQPLYPFFERSIAICRPIPLLAPTTKATFDICSLFLLSTLYLLTKRPVNVGQSVSDQQIQYLIRLACLGRAYRYLI